MEQVWRGRICINDQRSLDDIILSSHSDAAHGFTHDLELQFTSLVEVSRIPLYLTLGQPFEVTTTCVESQDWFSSILCQYDEHNHDHDLPWWRQVATDSPLGVLVSVSCPNNTTGHAKSLITEILFYASQIESAAQKPPTPPLSPGRSTRSGPRLYALALSSKLHQRVSEVIPPDSKHDQDDTNDGIFLSFDSPEKAAVIYEPPIRKRKTAADKFDEQTERSKKARSEAAKTVLARHSEPTVPTLKHSRSVSGVSNHSYRKSRSPSISRPASVRGASEAHKRSSLSLVQAVPLAPDVDSIEGKNKELISRMVMAGMRLYGLSQSKPRRSRAGSHAPEMSVDERESARKNDEEFKVIYHQAYKGVCFTFRQYMSSTILQPYGDALRETLDKFLGLFCGDPLAVGLPDAQVEYTPGGQRIFGSSHDAGITAERSPFQQPSTSLHAPDSEVIK